MWTIWEAKTVQKVLAKAPRHIVEKYEVWKSIVRNSGPAGLRVIKGLHDEALSGEWQGYRSSRLSEQWRVLYEVAETEIAVHVLRVTPHDYRR